MIVDFHMHLPGGHMFERWTTAQFLKMMDDSGIDAGVIFTIDGFFTENYVESNNLLYNQTSECPSRLIPFCSVNPRQGQLAVEETRRSLSELGMKGIKFHPWLQGFSPLQFNIMDPICELAIEFDVPIIFHDGTPPYSAPLQIGFLASRFPQCKMILGHGGLFDMWQEAVIAVNRNENLSVCLCGTAPQAIFSKIVSSVEPDRLLFGTDAGFGKDNYMPRYRVDEVLKMPLKESTKEGMLYKNAYRLLKMADQAK
ncbi:amidohydrolase family protein [Paenibacillus solisilvae]|uniref:Amidohydrolase family protein n=1 Tax=Paenibacillus solisilvae TaxID=2486751 RepID=A0ABW0W0J6_9BACL